MLEDLATLDARVSVCRTCSRLVAWREQVATTGCRASFTHELRALLGTPGAVRRGGGRAYLRRRTGSCGQRCQPHRQHVHGDRSGDWLWGARPPPRRHGHLRHLPVCCAPPSNRPTAAEKATCLPCMPESSLICPQVRVLVVLGGIAWDTTLWVVRQAGWTVPRPRPRFGHGAEV